MSLVGEFAGELTEADPVRDHDNQSAGHSSGDGDLAEDRQFKEQQFDPVPPELIAGAKSLLTRRRGERAGPGEAGA
jgi:hypothetical protein